jgi:hypothetical protein
MRHSNPPTVLRWLAGSPENDVDAQVLTQRDNVPEVLHVECHIRRVLRAVLIAHEQAARVDGQRGVQSVVAATCNMGTVRGRIGCGADEEFESPISNARNA